jgi:RimJ/RimL family protein N-acetyltransferase
MSHSLSVREMTAEDIPLIAQYWLTADAAYLEGMGVDVSKMPAEADWHKMLTQQLSQAYTEKQSYCMIWLLDGRPIGHSNVNKIVYGQEAYMHLHIWYAAERQMGLGQQFIRLSLPYFFQNLQLKIVYCEPYALNPSPNKTLEKVGFTLLKNYTTTPGWLNVEQSVNLWALTLEAFEAL